MKNKIKLGILWILSIALTAVVTADVGDIWAIPGPSGASVGSSWRIDLNGHLIPGTTATYNIGDSTHKVLGATISGLTTISQLKYGPPTAITANTTLTVANGSMIFMDTSAGNRTLTLPSAVVAGSGWGVTVQLVNAADATHQLTLATTAGLINTSATKAITTAYGRYSETSNGTDYFGTP